MRVTSDLFTSISLIFCRSPGHLIWFWLICTAIVIQLSVQIRFLAITSIINSNRQSMMYLFGHGLIVDSPHQFLFLLSNHHKVNTAAKDGAGRSKRSSQTHTQLLWQRIKRRSSNFTSEIYITGQWTALNGNSPFSFCVEAKRVLCHSGSPISTYLYSSKYLLIPLVWYDMVHNVFRICHFAFWWKAERARETERKRESFSRRHTKRRKIAIDGTIKWVWVRQFFLLFADKKIFRIKYAAISRGSDRDGDRERKLYDWQSFDFIFCRLFLLHSWMKNW